MILPEYGCLADPEMQSVLTKAQKNPEQWTVYLVPEKGDKRTLAQNRLYHALIAQLAQLHGQTTRYWSDLLVEKFLGWTESVSEDGFVRRTRASTSELTVPEFSRFLNACLAWAAQNTQVISEHADSPESLHGLRSRLAPEPTPRLRSRRGREKASQAV